MLSLRVLESRYLQIAEKQIWFEALFAIERGSHLSRDLAYQLLHQSSKFANLALCSRMQYLMALGGLDSISVLGDHLIRLFASCDGLIYAKQTFNKVSKPISYTWNAIIDAHFKLFEGGMAIQLYFQMACEFSKPDKITFLIVLKVCSSICAIHQGRCIHEKVVATGFRFDNMIGNTLVHMYAKCGSLQEAHSVFCGLQDRDVVSWNAMIAGYIQQEEGCLAFKCFQSMEHELVQPDKVTFLSILKACATMALAEQGRYIHQQIIDTGLQYEITVGNTLVDMYVKCGNLNEACKVFNELPNPDAVSWGAMIAGYAQHDMGSLAIECFENMHHYGIKPDEHIFSSMLKACGGLAAIEQGKHIHKQAIEKGFDSQIVVANATIDMYTKCGSMQEAQAVFNALQNQDVVSWVAIIMGHGQLGNASFAVQWFEEMEFRGINPNDVAFIAILTAISRVGLVDEGLWYFRNMRDCHGMKADLSHVACMVDLFSHAGCFKEAEQFVESMWRNTCLWVILLNACKMHSNMQLGQKCFDLIVYLNPNCVAAYVMMSNVYAENECILQSFIYR